MLHRQPQIWVGWADLSLEPAEEGGEIAVLQREVGTLLPCRLGQGLREGL